MPQTIILPSAQSDLNEIWSYIAQDSLQNADRLIDRIQELCGETLAYQPMMGRSREELAPELRSFPLQNYIIFYRPIDEGVEIIHVYEGHRDIEALFH